MADYLNAYMFLEGIEGGYSNDPDDRGGETYKGIARNFHPEWEGWQIIDGHDKTSVADLNMALDRNDDLQRLVEAFYKTEFWDRFSGDQIPRQRLADELFEQAVNLPWQMPERFLQRALNALNRNEALYKDMKVDGLIGPVTLAALERYLKHDNEHLLIKLLNVQQGDHYLRLMESDPTQEKYARGWFSRVEIYVS